MKNYHNQEIHSNTLFRYFFIIILAFLFLLAGPAGIAAADDDGGSTLKKGLDRGLQQGQEPATPQRQCPQGMKWSDREGACISDLKTSTQTGGGGGKLPGQVHHQHKQKGSPSGR